ncbi:MAG: VgrG-related protein [Chloroflexota bacterium]
MADAAPTTSATVEIDGQPLSVELIPKLERVVVDDYLHLPDMFMLVFQDKKRDVLQEAGLRIGSRIKIAAKGLNSTGPEQLMSGEVTAIEAQYGPLGNRAVVRGYDFSHRLHGGRQTETYRDVKDCDVARTVALRAGLKIGTIEQTGPTHDHVSQVNLTDWEFLNGCARSIGFEISVEEDRFNFRKPTPSSEAPGDGNFNTLGPTQLVLGQELLEFAPRLSSKGQVKEVKVRSWDPAQKRALVGSATAAAASAELQASPASLAAAFGDPVHVTVDRPLATQAAVDANAGAVAEQIGSTFAEAEGLARGDPKLKAGTAVSVSVVGADFEGKYVLSQARHEFDQRGYHTRFTVSGRQERSMLALTAGNGTAFAGTAAQKIHGVVPALVSNNNDPKGWGRVKLKFPWLADNYESDWARMTQIGAGPNSGAMFLPEVDDEVLVAFEYGDTRMPVVIGALYNGKDKPRLGKGLVHNGKVRRRGFVSRRGHQATFLDDPGKSGIALITGNNKLKIALKETGTVITVFSSGQVEIRAGGNIAIKADANLDIEAGANLTLKAGAGLNIKAGSIVDIDGAIIQLN